jgi:biopolymer transport protein ExbB/TolQ
MTQLIQNTLDVITQMLLWPVIIVLMYGIFLSLYKMGNMLVEFHQRKGHPESIRDIFQPSNNVLRLYGIQEFNKQLKLDYQAALWLLHDRTETSLKRKIDSVRIWVKLGPALGLAGTLIPLGSALQAVGVNNLKLLSDQLSIAFGSTVLGLTIGVINMIIASSYERWYALDLAEIRQAIENQEKNSNTTF